MSRAILDQADCNDVTIPINCFSMGSRVASGAVLAVVVSLGLGAGIQTAGAHGGVVEEDDACVMRISYLKAHFKVYQPLTDGHDEYCEDLPSATESVFVLEYLHDELATVPIEFRIIENVTGKGRFARWEDIASIGDLDAATVFYQEPVVDPDVFTAIHRFDEAGSYIGIVTAKPGSEGRRHVAVFPFDVGYTGLGYWPYVVAVVLLLQLQYLWSSGRVAKWREQRRIGKPELRVMQGGQNEH